MRALAAHGQERFFRSGALVAQIDERGDHIFFYGACRHGTGFCSARGRGEFVAEFEHHAFGSLLADAGNAGEAGEIAIANRSDHFVGGHTAQDFYGQGWANPTDGEQLFEKMFFSES